CRAWFCSWCSGVKDWRTLIMQRGNGRPKRFCTSGCSPDVILSHHRAAEARLPKTGCRGWNRTVIRAFKGHRPTIGPLGNELVEPEVVATHHIGLTVRCRSAVGSTP